MNIIILAAGKSSRMHSTKSKIFHEIAGREVISYVMDLAVQFQGANILIVANRENGQQLEKSYPQAKIVYQEVLNGTGGAVQVALDKLDLNTRHSLILYGDTPLVEYNTLQALEKKMENYKLAFMAFDYKEENRYGRLVTRADELLEIVEYKDANEEQRKIELCNSGIIMCDTKLLQSVVPQIDNKNASGEYYLTDIITIARNQGEKATYFKTNYEELIGVNSREDLAILEENVQDKLRKKIMAGGVTLLDPKTTYFSYDTIIEQDTIIAQNVVFSGKVRIGKNVHIKSFTHIEDAEIEENSVIGPFARIRPGSKLKKHSKIGNFVEIKNSVLEEDVKVNHLSYIGDAELGKGTNIGAGTITCNYDGVNKHRTKIGKNVMIGSNSSLVAPIEIEDNAYVAAGSVINQNVPKQTLAVARAKQVNYVGKSKMGKKND